MLSVFTQLKQMNVFIFALVQQESSSLLYPRVNLQDLDFQGSHTPADDNSILDNFFLSI